MTRVTVSRFNNVRRPNKNFKGRVAVGYSYSDATIVETKAEDRLQGLVQYIENCVVQLRHGSSASGLSFASWSGGTNHKSNLQMSYALALDYKIEQFEGLRERAAKLGFACVFATTENKASTQNAITLIIPFSAPVSAAQYERIACCVMSQLDVYGALEGNIAATHIVNVHATTLAAFERGQLFDPQSFLVQTANAFQSFDAKKYEGEKPAAKVRAQIERPTYTSDCGLFELAGAAPNTANERIDAVVT